MTIRIAIMLIAVVCALIAARKALVAAAKAAASDAGDDARETHGCGGTSTSATRARR